MVHDTEASLWHRLNQQLVAKNISELQYEECLVPEPSGDGWHLRLASGVEYRFQAWRSIWGQLRVNSGSLLRDGSPVTSAAQFYIDAQQDLELDAIVLANLLEECAQTLYGDRLAWLQREQIDAAALAQLDVDRQQVFLDGHPKAVLNKGRLGWGSTELQQFAPESGQPVRLRWIAVAASECTLGAQRPGQLQAMVRSAMSEREYRELRQTLQRHTTGPDVEESWHLLPVHPWQWQHKIRIQFQEWLARGRMLDLGVHGHRFLPLQSIRTLANLDCPTHPNVKLPLTILNTSCYRGIPGQYIAAGGVLSAWLQTLCRQDALLSQRGTLVLQEPVGVTCNHPRYGQIDAAPYRYHEMLGVIWRQSVQSQLQPGERAMLMAGLLQQDNRGDSVVRHLIVESGMSPEQWVTSLFGVVVVPLYHLMCQYGVGLVAHGQNLTLILEQGRPRRLALKDLQGDLRLVDQDFPELESLPPQAAAVLTRLPPEYLLHDLLTGHFVTVLRYLSALMQEQGLLSETDFYRTLATVLRNYQRQYPQLAPRFRQFDLLAPIVKRVCINRVRFREGYADRQQRPVPVLGSDLSNPLIAATGIEAQEIA
ncbi:MAG: hypothetical protein CML06_07985 [Pseudomonadales bacterium]|nr:hypothetical protein [Pseudomonadales bacterium]